MARSRLWHSSNDMIRREKCSEKGVVVVWFRVVDSMGEVYMVKGSTDIM